MLNGGKNPPVWARRDGTPIEELHVGEWYGGEISYVGDFVFVDIGANYDAILKIPPHIGRQLQVGTRAPVELLKIDVQSGEVVAQLDRQHWPSQALVGERKGKGHSEEGKGREKGNPGPVSAEGKGREKGKSKADRVPINFQQLPDHDQRTPLEDLEEGDVVSGHVKNTGRYGVFFDIGAQSDARLASRSPQIGDFKIGDFVTDLRIDWVNTILRRIQVSLLDRRDPQAAQDRQLPKKSSTPSWNDTTIRSSMDGAFGDMQRGMFIDGIVTGKSSSHVYVDIGRSKCANLKVATELLPEFKVGDKIIGMEVTHVNYRLDNLYLSLDEPSIDGDNGNTYTAPPQMVPQARHQPRSKPAVASTQGADQSGASVGSFVNGTVTRVTTSMVYVDIGFELEAHLLVPPEMRRQFRKSDKILGMVVEFFKKGHAVLSLEDPVLDSETQLLEDAPTRQSQAQAARRGATRNSSERNNSSRPAGAGFASPGRPSRQQSVDSRLVHSRDDAPTRPGSRGDSGRTTPLRQRLANPRAARDTWSDNAEYAPPRGKRTGHSHSNSADSRVVETGSRNGARSQIGEQAQGRPLQELRVGDEVTGIVSKLNSKVYLDFGAVVDGLLDLAPEDVEKFRLGDQVEGALIDHIDLKKRQVTLSLPWELQEPCEVFQ